MVVGHPRRPPAGGAPLEQSATGDAELRFRVEVSQQALEVLAGELDVGVELADVGEVVEIDRGQRPVEGARLGGEGESVDAAFVVLRRPQNAEEGQLGGGAGEDLGRRVCGAVVDDQPEVGRPGLGGNGADRPLQVCGLVAGGGDQQQLGHRQLRTPLTRPSTSCRYP